jgi:hypothetical protein
MPTADASLSDGGHKALKKLEKNHFEAPTGSDRPDFKEFRPTSAYARLAKLAASSARHPDPPP